MGKKKPTPRRKLLRKAAERLARLTRTKPIEPEPETTARKPDDPNYEKPASEVELSYNTKTAPAGTQFTDARNRSYAIEDGGQLRVLNKPRSRVKRLREERRRRNEKSGTDSQRPAQSDN